MINLCRPTERMANPVSIVQAIIDLALKIKKEAETFRHNREDCRKIGELVATVRAVAEAREPAEEHGGGGRWRWRRRRRVGG